MKSLNDNDFASMVAGSDEPYQNADKKRQTKDELEISKLEFSKEHNIDLNVINDQLKDVKDNPLNYAKKILEVSELKAELKRVERLGGKTGGQRPSSGAVPYDGEIPEGPHEYWNS